MSSPDAIRSILFATCGWHLVALLTLQSGGHAVSIEPDRLNRFAVELSANVDEIRQLFVAEERSFGVRPLQVPSLEQVADAAAGEPADFEALSLAHTADVTTLAPQLQKEKEKEKETGEEVMYIVLPAILILFLCCLCGFVYCWFRHRSDDKNTYEESLDDLAEVWVRSDNMGAS
mmetsp:Transcript_57124/g.123615  ORF Transcript_57124/g.123615 Transcript_57124/m.123615 type:complete len:175 (+) Transcript_57124:60-584(+)